MNTVVVIGSVVVEAVSADHDDDTDDSVDDAMLSVSNAAVVKFAGCDVVSVSLPVVIVVISMGSKLSQHWISCKKNKEALDIGI